MSLFVLGDLVLASGKSSNWKIEADALVPSDWKTLAAMAGPHLTYGRVVGVPTGGERFAEPLRRYARPDCETVLVADDVLTTGGSIERVRRRLTDGPNPPPVVGLVAFARGPLPDWVRAVFCLSPWLLNQGDPP